MNPDFYECTSCGSTFDPDELLSSDFTRCGDNSEPSDLDANWCPLESRWWVDAIAGTFSRTAPDDAPDKFTVVSVSNMGEQITSPAADQVAANKLAKSERVTGNHMVCIDVNGTRVSRWDRDRIEGENRWMKTDPNEMETLGPIRQMARA